MGELQKIQPFVQRVAGAIAAALKVEVEIVDDHLLRVGGTGRLLGSVGTRQKRGFVNQFVLKSGQSCTIKNPGQHHLCRVCDLNGKCFYTAGIFCPINMEDRTIGMISLISFDEEQRVTLLTNEQTFLDFIGRMADLLASKALENQAVAKLQLTSKQLDTIINTIKEGIIAVNKNGCISYFNRASAEILGIKSKQVVGKKLSHIFPNSPLNEVLKNGKKVMAQEVLYEVENRRVSVVSTAFPIQVQGEIAGAVESFSPVAEVQKLAYHFSNRNREYTSFEQIIGNSRLLRQAKEQARKISISNSSVLLEGESGTGKELFARAIHYSSPRRNKPFVAINCSAIPDTLLESELFGYEEGAFTGAKHGGKPGKFELADGGTIFLDEIGEMPLYLQSKLLRVLQERSIERVGGLKTIPIDVRIIAATNRDLGTMVKEGQFRADLYYRLNVIPIKIPPLREREEDILLLMDFFLQKYNRLFNRQFKGFSEEARNLMLRYHWPGNVREVENAIEYACNLEAKDIIGLDSLPPKLKQTDLVHSALSLREKWEEGMRQVTRKILQEAFRRYGTSAAAKEQIAEALGISRATLYRRIKELGDDLTGDTASQV